MHRLIFASLTIAVLSPGIAAADDQADAMAILDKVITAHGGEAALGKVLALRCKAKATGYEDGQKKSFHFDWTFQGLDKMRAVSTDDETKTDTIEVVNGRNGWIKDADKDTETMSDAQLASRREIIYLNWITEFAPLKSAEYHLSPLGEMSVAGRKTVGILVRHSKHDAVKLYFDQETHLFAKYERRFMNVEAGKECKEEASYSDYKTVQGIKLPFNMETDWDGTKVSDCVITSVEISAKPLDEKLYAKP